MSNDPIDELRRHDPVRDTDLSRIDTAAHRALREGIMMTTSQEQRPTRRISRRLAAVAGAATIATVTAGGAYAMFADRGETVALECRDAADSSMFISASTGDPVADCRKAFEASSSVPSGELVVAKTGFGGVVVTSKDLLRSGEQPLAASEAAQDPATIELAAAMQDVVDAPGTGCATGMDGARYAATELRRLGLSDWKVTGDEGAGCVWLEADSSTRTVKLLPIDESTSGGDTELRAAVAGVKSEVSEGCLGVEAAKASVTKNFVAHGIEITPEQFTVTDDPKASCTRVDIVPGGTFDVRLYGRA